MLKIGEFSKLSHLTIKALRFYEKRGLLIPQKVDEQTGYRFYETSQLKEAARIKSYRQLGLSIEEINLGVMTTLASQAGEFESVVSEVLKAITEAIATEEQMKIYTSGATNIFKYPELSDKERASQLLTTLEEKSQLTELINEGDEKTGIQVYIGSESPVQSMKDCSVVTATYELEDGFKGTIGIIGPKRMDYEKVVDALRNVKEQLSDTFKDEHL